MRRLLLGMGLVLTCVIGLGLASIGTVAFLAVQTRDDNTANAIELVQTVSQTWSIDHTQETFSPVALAQASTPAGRKALSVMSRLGMLNDTHNVSQTGYKIDFETGTTVTVTFDGHFDHGIAAVTVVLRYIDDKARIVELDMKKIRLVRKRQRRVAV